MNEQGGVVLLHGLMVKTSTSHNGSTDSRLREHCSNNLVM